MPNEHEADGIFPSWRKVKCLDDPYLMYMLDNKGAAQAVTFKTFHFLSFT